MNKNIVKYPIRFGTLLLAGAALVACQKTQFTEQDAWILEKSRLTTLKDLELERRAAAEKERVGALTWNRVRDSLNNINAGGRVYYTVIPVAANQTAFNSGGRTEEAILNATVTITQYGRAFTNTTVAGANGTPLTPGGTSANGVYTFSELRSGEVTVNITAANFTQVNYIANLTPDGGVSNNGTVNVGNTIPMFELATVAGTKMATVKGKAWYEGDLTNTTEEQLTDGILGANLVTASIDVNGTFRSRFLNEANDENGSQYLGVATKSGFIQRISYSNAVTAATVNATGDYSMLVPASVTGLPIKLNFSEFAFNRTYYNNAGTVITNERFLYGPNVAPSSIPNPGTPSASLEVRAWDTDASASAVFTAQSNGAQPTNFNRTETYFNSANNTGFYVMAPTVTTATGTSTTAATFAVDTDLNVANNTLVNFLTYNSPNLTAGSADALAVSKGFKRVNGTVVKTGGVGYGEDQDLIFTRTDLVTGAGFGGQAAGTGLAGGYVKLSTTTPIQVTDGGAGFLRNPATTVSTPATFTNYLPTVVFSEGADASNAAPIVGYTGLTPAVKNATARVFVDYNATYTADNMGIAPNPVGAVNTGTPPGVGSIQEVRMIEGGEYPAGKLPFINFSFGESLSSAGFSNGKSLFVSDGNGGAKFNEGLLATDMSTIFKAAATVAGGGKSIDFTVGFGSAYTFVPKVELDANQAAKTAVGGTTLASSLQAIPVTTTVNSDPSSAGFGRITKLVLGNPATVSTGGTLGVLDNDFLVSNAPFAASATNPAGTFQISLKVTPNRYGNTLAAVGGASTGATLATGSALNSYSFSASAQTAAAASASALAGAMGNAVSNSKTVSLSVNDLIRGNNMLLVFDAPDNTAFANRKTAYGVPVWDNNTLIGARILDGGSGYGAAATPVTTGVNFTSSIKATLVPNPWFSGNVPVAGVSGPSTVPVTSGLTQNIIAFLNSETMMASSKAFRAPIPVTRARLALTVTPGSGYSRPPRFVVSGGGLNLTEYKNTEPIINKMSSSAGGVVTFNSRINAAGAVEFVGNGSTVGISAPIVNSATTAGLSQIYTRANGTLTDSQTETISGVVVSTTRLNNNFWFAVDNAPMYNTATSPLVVTLIEELSVRLTKQLNDSEVSGLGVGARVGIAATTAVPTGTVTSVTFNDGRSSMLMDDATATRMDQVDIQTGTVAAIGSLVPGPRINVIGAGTGATLQSYVTLDPNRSNLHRRITSIVVTAGGSGYGAARRNSYWRSAGPNGGTTATSQNGAAGQVFTIVGGMSGVSNQPGTNMANMSFDAMPGITLVRDVHYGTGVILD